MDRNDNSRATRFLMLYRALESALEKRYTGHRMSSSSVVMEYLHDPDSMPYRPELDLCREIRNILSHNADQAGGAVVEPSEEILETLQTIHNHIMRPRMAIDYGTPADEIMFAHPNDMALSIMRAMRKKGYSHVPVRDRSGLLGIFSAGSLFMYLENNGFDHISSDLRIGDLEKALDFGDERSEKYMFLPSDATLLTVRDAFVMRNERNNRLAVVFITKDGTRNSEILRMLTPWDVLKNGI